MINKLLFVFLFLSQVVSAQNLDFTITVRDSETNAPIDEVTITALKTRQGFLTNANGVAVLHLNKVSDLELVHSSYKTTIVKFISCGLLKIGCKDTILSVSIG